MTHQPGDRVMTHYFGPATLVKLYKHDKTKETVWEVAADTGEHLHLSQGYVDGLDFVITGRLVEVE